MSQPEKEQKNKPLFKAKYKVTEQDYAMHNLLIAEPSMAQRKRNITRYLILLSICEVIYYLAFVKGRDLSEGHMSCGMIFGVLWGLWATMFACFVYLHWLFGVFVKLVAKSEYSRDAYSKSEVVLEAFGDGVLETVTEPGFVEFSKICGIYLNKSIYVLISEERQTVVIPRNDETGPIIALIDEKAENLKFRYEESAEPERSLGSTREIVAEMLKK